MNIPSKPCEVVEINSAFRVNDAGGRAVAYVYFAEGSRLTAMGNVWTRKEARELADRIARGFSRLASKDE
jgi:hypothetical protein